MKTIKYTSKLAHNFMLEYERSRKIFLEDCYSKISTRKHIAYRDCKDKMFNELGHSFRILSYNTFFFTCGWLVNNGSMTDLRIETPNHSYVIKDYLPF